MRCIRTRKDTKALTKLLAQTLAIKEFSVQANVNLPVVVEGAGYMRSRRFNGIGFVAIGGSPVSCAKIPIDVRTRTGEMRNA